MGTVYITSKLRQGGWTVNAKRVYRLWRREGLKVPQKKRDANEMQNPRKIEPALPQAQEISVSTGVLTAILLAPMIAAFERGENRRLSYIARAQ